MAPNRTKPSHVTALVFLAMIVAGCNPAPPEVATLPDGVDQLAMRADALPWGPCPPGLPAGCEIAVLEGNPQGNDLFTVRFRLTEPLHMPPHTHPKEERVTVLAGQLAVTFDVDTAKKDAEQFGPGDYYVNARDTVHIVWADAGSEIQITGIGPWRADFVTD